MWGGGGGILVGDACISKSERLEYSSIYIRLRVHNDSDVCVMLTL